MRQTSRSGVPTPRSALAAATVAAVAASLLLAGCTSDEEDAPAPAAAPTSPSSAPELPLKVSVATVAGRLPKASRTELSGKVEKVLDGWFEAAYLGGEYPRSGKGAWGDSWPGFTKGAAEQARHDRLLMSNRDIGARIEGVEAKRKVARLDVLAPQGKPAGVTARVTLRFATTDKGGEKGDSVLLRGRLYLTRGNGGGWQVFGYDVTKDTL